SRIQETTADVLDIDPNVYARLFRNKNNASCAFIVGRANNTTQREHTLATGAHSYLCASARGNLGIKTTSPTTFDLEVNGTIGPNTDNNRNLGSASRRMSTIYAGTGTINTSDGRLKSVRSG